MDGKIIAGISIASITALMGFYYLYRSVKYRDPDPHWADITKTIIYLLLSIVTFILIGIKENDSSKPDIILQTSLSPHYASSSSLLCAILLGFVTGGVAFKIFLPEFF